MQGQKLDGALPRGMWWCESTKGREAVTRMRGGAIWHCRAHRPPPISMPRANFCSTE